MRYGVQSITLEWNADPCVQACYGVATCEATLALASDPQIKHPGGWCHTSLMCVWAMWVGGGAWGWGMWVGHARGACE